MSAPVCALFSLNVQALLGMFSVACDQMAPPALEAVPGALTACAVAIAELPVKLQWPTAPPVMVRLPPLCEMAPPDALAQAPFGTSVPWKPLVAVASTLLFANATGPSIRKR